MGMTIEMDPMHEASSPCASDANSAEAGGAGVSPPAPYPPSARAQVGTEELLAASGPRASRRSHNRVIFSRIVEVAEPGDVIFLISDYAQIMPQGMKLRRLYQRYMGMAPNDLTKWHIALYVGPRKERNSGTVRPVILHAVHAGVKEDYIMPSFFTNRMSQARGLEEISRIEVARFRGLTDEQRATIVRYCYDRVGMPFGEGGFKYTFWTYLLGLPAFAMTGKRIDCQTLVYRAYAEAGIDFPHHLEWAPFLNLGRLLGHPLGHPRDRVNLRYAYLEDYHFYRDPRVSPVLAISQDANTFEVSVEENPGKYSWNPVLRTVYACDNE
jgi:hypothetical protein